MCGRVEHEESLMRNNIIELLWNNLRPLVPKIGSSRCTACLTVQLLGNTAISNSNTTLCDCHQNVCHVPMVRLPHDEVRNLCT